MKRLPILLSLPHGGVEVPSILRDNCLLSREQIVRDGDEYAGEIYLPLKDEVSAFVATDIARAVLDMNREEGDIRTDGVVKTHTCWDEPVWRRPLDRGEIRWLLVNHHRPYHRRLSQLAERADLLFAVDCHTMAAQGPPIGPDPGAERPQVCLGNVNGESCPNDWLEELQLQMIKRFPGEVTLNRPFSGGYITRHHGKEMPWIQLELSRGDFATVDNKSAWIRDALKETVRIIRR